MRVFAPQFETAPEIPPFSVLTMPECRVCGDLKVGPCEVFQFPSRLGPFLNEIIASADGDCPGCKVLLNGVDKCWPTARKKNGVRLAIINLFPGKRPRLLLSIRRVWDDGDDSENNVAEIEFFTTTGTL